MTQLEYMEFGHRTLHTIEQIYFSQDTKIIGNSDLSISIQIQKGTRQGCPLSPLLFILSLEVLLNQIRTNRDIKGLKTKGFQFKLEAFGDDLMNILKDSDETVIPLCHLLDHYSQISDLKINFKSHILTKNMTNL